MGGRCPPSTGLSVKPLCSDLQGTSEGDSLPRRAGHLSPGGRTQWWSGPGQDAGLCTRVGESVLVLIDMKRKTSEQA